LRGGSGLVERLSALLNGFLSVASRVDLPTFRNSSHEEDLYGR
jgi:hypothetical protein